jgi:hypothetical protein
MIFIDIYRCLKSQLQMIIKTTLNRPLVAIILATQEADIRRIMVRSQPK